jgi:hypothetical protein
MQNNENSAAAEKTTNLENEEALQEKCRRLEEEAAGSRELIRLLTEENEALRTQADGSSPEEEVIEAFLAEFPQASGFFDDICDALAQDGSLAGAEGLNKAYMRVLSQKYKAPEQLAQDEEFLLKHIFCNEKIRERFIRQYLDSLPQAPDVCEKRGAIPVSAHSRPATLRSAGELARALFRK